MRTATELLAEMLAIHDDPDKNARALYLWLHQSVEEVKGVVEGGNHKYDRFDGGGTGHYVEQCQHDIVHGQCRCPSRQKSVRIVPCGAACRAAIDRARGEGE